MRAAQMLETFGFTDVTNVKGGFGGARDPMGRVDGARVGGVGAAGRHRRPARNELQRRCSRALTPRSDRAEASTPGNGGSRRSTPIASMRPFEWGLDWLGFESSEAPADDVAAWSRRVMTDTDQFFAAPPTVDYRAHRRPARVSQRHRDAVSREQHRSRARVSRRATPASRRSGAPSSCCRSGTPTPRVTSDSAGSSRDSGSPRCG